MLLKKSKGGRNDSCAEESGREDSGEVNSPLHEICVTVQGFNGSGVQRFRGSMVDGFNGSGVQWLTEVVH